MVKALSVDLRSRVVAAVMDGASHRAAAERFGVSAASERHAQEKRLEIWFQDEARVGQKNLITRRWATFAPAGKAAIAARLGSRHRRS